MQRSHVRLLSYQRNNWFAWSTLEKLDHEVWKTSKVITTQSSLEVGPRRSSTVRDRKHREVPRMGSIGLGYIERRKRF